MDEQTTGIILRTRPLTETSLIVHWLTPDLGRLATVAKGARRPKSPFQGKLDLFYRADLSFRRSRRSDLHTLCEVSVREFNHTLRKELGYLQQAAYFAKLLEQTTETETPLPTLFQLLLETLDCLAQSPLQFLTIYAFEIKLLHELGLGPDLTKCALTPGSMEALKRIAAADWQTVSRIRLSSGQNAEIGRDLEGFLRFHLGKIPAGRPRFE